MAGYRRPKRKAGMGYITILLIILIIIAAGAVFVSQRFAPSKIEADLLSYFNLTAYESENRAEAGSDELAIVINGTILDNTDGAFRAYSVDGGTYVALSLVQNYIDSRYYQDSNEGYLIFTNAVGSYIAPIDSTTVNYDGSDYDMGYVVARTINNDVYLNLDFVSEHSDVTIHVLDDPARVVLQTERGTFNFVTASADIAMRTSNSTQASILTTVKKDTSVRVLSTLDGWYLVMDDSGFIGYIQDNFTSAVQEQTISSDFTEPEYTHITVDGSINMVWHGIYYYESSYNIASDTDGMTGVNVLAPTWFLFSDEYGNLTSFANQEYVDYAHEQGWMVWAVLEDMDGNSDACTVVMEYTSRRQQLISQLVEQCLSYGIDGINVDLETITSSQGDDFIQFIRELSVACRNNNLILSVDDYAPYSYNAYRHTDEQSKVADYVAIMTYDDYVGTDSAGPNAGLPFVEEVLSLCQETVDMDRLIVGLPFYTRVWREYSDGTLSSEGVSDSDIQNMVWTYGLTWQWLEDVGYNYSEYESDGATVRIWYENSESLAAKLEVISQYNVAGVASWRLGQAASDVWAVLDQYY